MTSPIVKLTIVIMSLALAVTVSAGLGVAVGDDAGFISATAILIALVVLTARAYRGPDEAVNPPREWWRMSATPWGSFVLFVVFASQAVFVFGAGFGSGSRVIDWSSALIHAVIALAYLQSGSRQMTGWQSKES